jgi:hypothetical protein
MDVVSAVFQAEDAINAKSPTWKARLAEAKFADQETRDKVAQDYLYAIAEEIVSKTTDEELAKL